MSARRDWSWAWLLAAGVAILAGYLRMPQQTPMSDAVYNAVGWVALAGLLVGIRLHRPARRGPWYAFALAQLSSCLGDVLYWTYAYVLDQEPYPSIADAFYLLGYAGRAVAVFLLIRGRTVRRDVAGLLDASIISTGLGLLAWTVLMRPVAAGHGISLVQQLVSLAYPLADVLLIAMLVRLLTTPGARTASYWLLVAGLTMLMASDITYAILQTTSNYAAGVVDIGWLGSFLAVAAAAQHPSMRAVSEIAPSSPGRLGVRRFFWLGATTAVPPGLLVAQGLGYGDGIDWIGISVGSLLLFALVLTRVWTLVGQVQDQATQLEALAHNDALTGVANRRTWDLALPRDLAAAARSGTRIAIAIIDLDHFKRYNDTHGHQGGDLMLRDAASTWRALLREGDLLARYGGEEFGVLLPNAEHADAVATLERLLAATPHGQTFSAGVAVWDGVESPERLVGRADQALYAAKRAGRNCVSLAPTTMDTPSPV